MQLQALHFSGKKQLMELTWSVLLITGLFCFLYINQPKEVDWSKAPVKTAQLNIYIGSESHTGIQYLEVSHSRHYPITVTYKVLDEYLLQFTEQVLLTSPASIAPNTKTRVANYLPIDGMNQSGLGFSNFHTSYANNQNNITSKPYIPPIKAEALVKQAPNKDHFKPWMLKLNSHQGVNVNAIDFDVPIGTPIYAMAAGEVVSTYEDSDFGCLSKKCRPYGNELDILHEDGSVAAYAHLKQNGISVNLGDKVTAGQLVAYSGDTGSGGAHLHVQIEALQYSDDGETKITTLPLTFIDENETAIELSEGDYINATSMTATMMNRFNRAYYH
ncbi:Peptidase M23B [Shewanella piezotolerans WP3]|uniref:Peptidase M23B n=2 Tax=Shewanella TaxID=22 RepID=B8CLW1_SHEPW|nr:Peptidase M23B [Shewanella piezotolerans WP3]